MFRKLTTKFLFIITSLLLLCIISFAILSYLEIRNAVTAQMQSDGTTLINTVKRELYQGGIKEIPEYQNLFNSIKRESNGNITYVSISDDVGRIVVSDNFVIDGETSGTDAVSSVTTGTDAVSSATAGTDAVSSVTTDAVSSATTSEDSITSSVLGTDNIIGQMLMVGNEEVYNISTGCIYGNDLPGSLNIGISLTGMNQQLRKSFIEISTISIIIIVLALAIGTFVTNRLTRPIIKMSERMDDFAKGDFSLGIDMYGKDEIGKMSVALNHMRDTLSGTVGGIINNSKEVSDSSHNLSSIIDETSTIAQGITQASEDLAMGSSDLASSAQEGLESLNKLADEINNINQRAEVMISSIEKTSKANEIGTNSLRELQSAIADNVNVTENIREQVELLTENSQSITEITSVIKNIAKQTQLLALNASIESARAGESGKGFTVVATEIRKLSEQTSSSIAGIEEIVHELESSISSTRDYMHQGSQAINRTSETSEDTSKALGIIEELITNIISEIQDIIKDISKVNKDKNKVVGDFESISAIAQQASSSTEEISSVMEQQMANIEAVSLAAKKLQNIANELDISMSKFKIKA
ncbi:MAG: methyl-accepting chemotaxis protein, partial [Anaerolineaceae bacterium]